MKTFFMNLGRALIVMILVVSAGVAFAEDAWKEKLIDENLSRQDFVLLMEYAISEVLPSAKAELSDEFGFVITTADDLTLTANLQNLWDSIQSETNAEEKIKLFQSYLDSMKAVLKPKVLTQEDIERIVPILKPTAYFKEDDRDSLHAAWVGEMSIYYVFNTEHSMMSVSTQDLKQLGVEQKDLKELALNNIAKNLQGIQQFDMSGGDAHFLVVGGNFETSLLLLDDLWDDLSQKLGDDVVVGIPSRDLLIYTGAHHKEGLKKLTQIVEENYRENPYPLTDELFVRKEKEWMVFEAK